MSLVQHLLLLVGLCGATTFSITPNNTNGTFSITPNNTNVTTTIKPTSLTTEAPEIPECPSGWINAHEDGCFSFLEETNITWGEAMMACEEIGGYLAEPKSSQQMEFLAGLAGMEEQFTGTNNWWIGVSDVGHEGIWTWIHSYEEVTETFWAHGSPNEKPGNNLDCGYIQLVKDQLSWKDQLCGENKAHGRAIAPICQRGEAQTDNPTTSPTVPTTAPTVPTTTPTVPTSTTTASSTTTTSLVIECPYGWSSWNGSCYWLVPESKDWVSAREGCMELNPAAHLASSGSDQENAYLRDIVSDLSNSFIWLGGSDSHAEGNWTWTDGTPFNYTNWYSGEGDGGSTQNCVVISTYLNSVSYWFDDHCYDNHYFICEINLDY